MDNENTVKEESGISLLEIIRALIRRWWIILLCAVIGLGAAYGITSVRTTQKYTASSKVIISNYNLSSVGSTISSLIGLSDLNAGAALVPVYTALLKTYSFLNEFIEEFETHVTENRLREEYPDSFKAKYTEKHIGYVRGLLSCSQISETPILSINVTSVSGREAIEIANYMVDFLPTFLSTNLEGQLGRAIRFDFAVSASAVSRNFTRNALIGAFAGLVLAILAVIVIDVLLNDTIESEDFLKGYGDEIPFLATVPDVNQSEKYGYSYKNKYYKRYYASRENDAE